MRGVCQALVFAALLQRCPRPAQVELGRAPVCEAPVVPRAAPPAGAMRFVDISPTWSGTCGATEDGRVVCWGRHRMPGAPVDWRMREVRLPDGFRAVEVEAVATDQSGCARGEDGTVACWGRWALVARDWVSGRSEVAERIAGIGEAIDLAVSRTATDACAVSRDGRVRCWGEARAGRWRSLRDPWPGWKPTVLPGMRDAVAVTMSHDGTCAVGRSGQVTCWPHERPIYRLPVRDAVAVTMNDPFICAARRDGKVDCWGGDSPYWTGPHARRMGLDGVAELSGRFVRLADGRIMEWRPYTEWGSKEAEAVAAPFRAKKIASGDGTACALDEAGHAWCWGSNGNGETGVQRPVVVGEPTAVCGVDDVVQVAAGYLRTCFLRRDGHVWCAGVDMYTGKTSAVATEVPGVEDVVQMALAGTNGGCGARRDGRVVCWGDALRWGTPRELHTGPRLIEGLDGAVQVVVQGAVHDERLCALRSDGLALCAGKTSVPEAAPFPPDERFEQLAAGDWICGRTRRGSLLCWNGPKISGPCHRGGCVIRCEPDRSPAPRTAIASGVTYAAGSCAIARGQIACGDRYGSTRTNDLFAAVPVPAGISAGESMICAVTAGGAVWCSNPLGDDAEPVPGIHDAVAVSAGRSHACALRGDSTVVCWGENGQGQLGTGVGGDVLLPTPIDAPVP